MRGTLKLAGANCQDVGSVFLRPGEGTGVRLDTYDSLLALVVEDFFILYAQHL